MTPAERAALLLSFAGGHTQLKDALSALPEAALDFRPSPAAWTIRQIAVHLAEAEVHGYLRARFAIAQQGVTILPYDQNAWAGSFRDADQPLGEVLDLFKLLREIIARQLRALPEADWARSVRHPDLEAPLSLEAWLLRYENHLRVHLAQLARTRAAWEAADV